MKIHTLNGVIDTSNIQKELKNNVVELEKSLRECPSTAYKYDIGYIIPLGTLGNAPSHDSQFTSNFQIVAFNIEESLLSKSEDFLDFNLDELTDHGHITKLLKKVNDLAELELGPGWKIGLFNVKTAVTIESMCHGAKDASDMRAASDDLYNKISQRVGLLKSTTADNPWQHEVVTLFYAGLSALNIEAYKRIEVKKIKDEKAGITKQESCIGIMIEALVYDKYANGLRLLCDTEQFASSKMRQHTDASPTYLYVLKARIYEDEKEFIPIRQFGGESKVSNIDIKSGCSERIIYNIINKNYKHWSFISIPDKEGLPLKELKANVL